MAGDSQFDVSVVIPCYNAVDVVGRQLAALQRQTVRSTWEIIVADNGSTDESAARAAEYSSAAIPVVICDASDRRGINHARNIGVRHARGRFILLCDADDEVSEGWLAAMIEAFASGAGLVGGRLIRVGADETPVGGIDGDLRNDLNYLPWPQGANCGFTRAIYDEIGGFDETYKGGGDETDFFWRAQLRGYTLEFVSQATVRYTERSRARQRFRQNYYYGRSHVQLFSAFAANGMPRASSRGALRFWLTIPWHLLVGLHRPDRRRIAISRLGQRCGRIAGSAVYREWYV